MQYRIETAVERLFPNHGSLPPALPLDKYAGTYYHPAYQNLTLEIPKDNLQSEKKTLVAYNPDATWKISMTFEHVSGEYWIMNSKLYHAPTTRVLADYAAVHFQPGVDGLLAKMGIEWRDAASEVVDGWIWYDRVGS